MVGSDDRRKGAPSQVHIEKRKPFNWLAWLLLVAGLLALLLALSRCDRNEEANVVPEATQDTASQAVPDVVATMANVSSRKALAGTSSLGTYLAGTEPTPRTFTFEKLNFDSGKTAIRAADADEVDQVASTLAQYPNAKIRIVGYADALGAEPANVALGKARAESVKAALVTKGFAAARIETATGGESDPVDSNATVGGRLENRRTELIVTAR